MPTDTKTLKTIEEITDFFDGAPGPGIQIWSYSISHLMLDFAISHEKKPAPKFPAKTPPVYATMTCYMTNSMTIPEIAWNAKLKISETRGSDGRPTITVTNENSAFAVNSDHLYVTIGRHPNDYGMPLPDKADK